MGRAVFRASRFACAATSLHIAPTETTEAECVDYSKSNVRAAESGSKEWPCCETFHEVRPPAHTRNNRYNRSCCAGVRMSRNPLRSDGSQAMTRRRMRARTLRVNAADEVQRGRDWLLAAEDAGASKLTRRTRRASWLVGRYSRCPSVASHIDTQRRGGGFTTAEKDSLHSLCGRSEHATHTPTRRWRHLLQDQSKD